MEKLKHLLDVIRLANFAGVVLLISFVVMLTTGAVVIVAPTWASLGLLLGGALTFMWASDKL